MRCLALLLTGFCAAAAGSQLGLPPLQEEQQAPARAALGKRLFFDKRLSADGQVSCATCHMPERAFSDGRAGAIGSRAQLGTRNTPTLINVAYASSLFWEGRTVDLEAQALAPLLNPAEHALPSEQSIVAAVRLDSAYVLAFKRVFGATDDRITARLVGKALSAYERTLVAGGSAFDRFLYGGEKTALSAEAIRGLELFRGRAQCVSCHPIGERDSLFTDGDFHVAPTGLPTAVTRNLTVLAAKVRTSDHLTLERLIATDPDVAALGRFLVTGNPADIGKFKTPSLRNVALTAPYMHDGSVSTLERAVDLELYSRADDLRYPIVLTLAERRELVAFLNALTSPHDGGSM